MTPQHWLALSTLLLGVATYGILTRRSALGVLLCIEVALNAAALNFVVLGRHAAKARLDGQVMAMFVIAAAAAEAVVAIAIFVSFYRRRRSVDVDDARALKG